MALTYVAIATVTVGSGGAANIEFTSIPATYTDLQILASVRSDRNEAQDEVDITFNSNTSNYSSRNLNGSGSGTGSQSNLGATNRIRTVYINAATNTSNTFSSVSIYIPNYAGSNNKSVSIDVVQENNDTFANATLLAGLWSNTAAITSIMLDAGLGTNLVQYSTATLYGIKNTV